MNRQPLGQRMAFAGAGSQHPPGIHDPSSHPGKPQHATLSSQPAPTVPSAPGGANLWGPAAQPSPYSYSQPGSQAGLFQSQDSGPSQGPINFANLPKLGSQGPAAGRSKVPGASQAPGHPQGPLGLGNSNQSLANGGPAFNSPRSGANVNAPGSKPNFNGESKSKPTAGSGLAPGSGPGSGLGSGSGSNPAPPISLQEIAVATSSQIISPANGRASLASILPGLDGERPRLSIYGHPEPRNIEREEAAVAASLESDPLSLPYLESHPGKLTSLLKKIEKPSAAARAKNTAYIKTATDKMSETDKYGMATLSGVIKGDAPEFVTLPALGTDTSTLGLQPSANGDQLSRTFGSPWLEASKHNVVPAFHLPDTYKVTSVVPQQQKLQNLTEETLFYIFYTMPRDAMQEAVAVELTNRNWRYHKELKLWLTKDPLTEPVQQSAQAESGIYVFFDPSSWEKVKREYVLHYPDIA